MARYVPRCLATIQVIFDGFGGDERRPLIVETVPKTATVHSNGPHEADTFELEFDATKMPLHPDLIRAAGVDIYMFQVERLDEKHDPTAEPIPENPGLGLSVRDFIRAGLVEGAGRAEDLAIAGLVDDVDLDFSEQGKVLRLSGRDYTALLLDEPWPTAQTKTADGKRGSDTGKRFPVGKPIDETVQELVDEVIKRRSGNFTMPVIFIGEGDAPVVGTTSLAATFGKVSVSKKGRVRIAPSVSDASPLSKKGHAVRAGSSYWDVISRQCEHLGLICYVRDRNIIIGPPHVLVTAADLRKSPAAAFDGNLVETPVYKLAWGRNLSRLSVNRHIGGKRVVPTVVVRSYDPVTRKPIEGRWPRNAKDEADEAKTGIGTSRNEVINEEFLGVTEPEVLEQIAKMRYHALARSESRTKFATRDLKDLDGNNLLPLRAMDALATKFDAFNREELISKSVQEREVRLLALGYEGQVARLVAENLEQIHQFEKPLYVTETTMRWDIEDGIAIDGDAENFVDGTRDDLR